MHVTELKEEIRKILSLKTTTFHHRNDNFGCVHLKPYH